MNTSQGKGVTLASGVQPMRHLAFTGPLAGERFCGAPRDAGESSHLPYTATLSSEFRATITCEDCLAVYDETGKEEP